jgi:hypothetical protein
VTRIFTKGPVLGLEVGAVGARGDALDPGAVVDVPLHRRLEAGFEGVLRRPAQLGADLGRVDRVAAIVARAILHVLDQRLGLSGELEDPLHDLDVLPLGVATDVVDVAGLALLERDEQRRAVILDVEPVANVRPIAVHGQRLVVEGVVHHQRDELLGELKAAVVVRAAGDDDVHPEGVMPRERDQVGRGLRGRVGARRLQRAGLAEGTGRTQRAVHLVGRDLEEALHLRGARGLEQDLGAQDVGDDELPGSEDRTIDVALGRQVHHRVDAVGGEELGEELLVVDVAADEDVLRIAFELFEVLEVPRVGELVEVDDLPVGPHLAQVAHQVRSDEAATAGNQQIHGGGRSPKSLGTQCSLCLERSGEEGYERSSR